MQTMKQTLFLLLLSGVFMMIGCEQSESIVEEPNLIVDPTSENATQLEDFKIEGRSNYKRPTYVTVSTAIQCAGLNSTLFSGQKTLYAPTDEAFEKIGITPKNVCVRLKRDQLVSILTYHLITQRFDKRDAGCRTMANGKLAVHKRSLNDLFVNDITISQAWEQKSGSRYHFTAFGVDEVLQVPSMNIAETAIALPDFNFLVAAIVAADPSVFEALKNPDARFTVFAPTDKAFERLFKALGVFSIDGLVNAIGRDGLTNVLLYHVVDACAGTGDLRNGMTINTLLGQTVQVDLNKFQLRDKTAMPANLSPGPLDVITNNGVIHVIDKVLLPNL